MSALRAWQVRHGITDLAMSELTQLFQPQYFPTNKQSEEGVQDAIRLAAANMGNALWRNNSGALKDATGRLVRYGLGNTSPQLNEVWKSSDLIGATRYVVKPQDVGRTLGVLTAIEVKKPGWRGPTDDHEKAQSNFLGTVEGLGGFATFAQSVDDYVHKVTTS